MITIADATIYSTNGAMAFELTYSEGTKVRALQTRDGLIRKEYKAADGSWKLSGKPYLVKRNVKRQAEHIKLHAQQFLSVTGSSA